MVATFGQMLTLADKHEDRSRRITEGADKTHNTKDFVAAARTFIVIPHFTWSEKGRSSNIDGRMPRTPVPAACCREGVQPSKPRLCFNPWL